ncbi:MAG TPA: HAD-IA family hydrolase [Anaerolineae bacterium]|nr:HAD-IA family hydrolase [Anaerolineae bacterium]
MRYDAVLFDVGGTLIGFADAQPFRQFLLSAGLPAGSQDGRRLRSRFLAVLRAERDRALGVGATEAALGEFWRSVFSLVWPTEPGLAAAMYDAFRANRFDRLLDDVQPTLDLLRRAGLRLGVVSNFTSGLDALLAQLGVRDYFEFVITSALVGLAKPDPRIFDLATRCLSLPRRRLLYVGDHYGDDILGARAAGLDAVLVDRELRARQRVCARVGRLSDLVRYVRVPSRPALAILFDFDGVILDSFSVHLRAWQETLQPLGIRIAADDLASNEGIPTEPMARLFLREQLGCECDANEIARLAATKRKLFVRNLRPRPIPGILQLLHDLHGRGYRIGLVTGAARADTTRSLKQLGALDLFEVIVASDDTARGKPSPEPYQAAAAALGLSVADCLAIENAPMGIQSACAAGMTCVALETTLPARRLARASCTFRDATALSTWLLSF